MKKVTTKIYKFSELSKPAKAKAIEEFADVNTSYDWWDCTFDDAKEIGLNITGFDLSYRHSITEEFTDSAKKVAEAILENHGPTCQTYKTATEFLISWKLIAVTTLLRGTEEANEEAEEKLNELIAEFLKDILDNYIKMLEKEYDYLQSDEAIEDTIEANEYEFYKDGTHYSAHKMKAA